MTVIPFATNSYSSRSLPISAQRVVNCYAEKEPEDAETPVAVFGSPGLTAAFQCGVGPVRGFNLMNGVLYVVSGQRLYSVASLSATPVDIGGAIGGSGFVPMTNNGTQVNIVNGTNSYIYSIANGFQVVTDSNFHAAVSTTFFDNYFVYPWTGTNKFFISNSLDGTTFNGINFASAEVAPDLVLSIVNQQENLLIFGGNTIEAWYDAGALNFPFLRVNSGTIERGCAAALTPVKEDNSVFFLGDDLVFYRLNGTALVRVSTHAIEQAFQSYVTVSDAYCFSYTFEGHKFVHLVFPRANANWVFDIATEYWHERESWDQNNSNLGRWRGNCTIEAFGEVLIGDAYSGQVGFLDATVSTEFGNTVQMVMTAPPLHKDRKWLFVGSLELEIESGTGINSGQGSDPQIMIDYSKDGGRTFNDLQRFSTIGKIGAFLTRCRWLQFGAARQWVFRAIISDPIKRVVLSAHADIESEDE